MAKSNVFQKKKQITRSTSYAALKAKNELYFQLASIFSAIRHDEENITEIIIENYLPERLSKKIMDNSI
jgi:predicted transcriptional regulator